MYEWGSVSKADPTRIGYVRILRRQRSANFTAVLASGVFFYLIYGTVGWRELFASHSPYISICYRIP